MVLMMRTLRALTSCMFCSMAASLNAPTTRGSFLMESSTTSSEPRRTDSTKPEETSPSPSRRLSDVRSM
jgi:hypothetical protein